MQKRTYVHNKLEKPYVNSKKKAKIIVYDYLKKNGAQWLSTIADNNNIEFEILLEALAELEKERKIKEVSEDQIGKRI